MNPFIIASLLAAPAPVGIDLARATIVYRADAPELERFAALELRRYLSQLAGKPLPIARSGRIPEGVSIAVGSAAEALGGQARVPEALGGQGFIQRVAGETLVLRGRAPVGTLYAVYDLLERLGMGFYLGGDAYPPSPAPLRIPRDLAREARPAFRIRGSLPWYNFLNSPTGWNREDFKAFFDQMAKMRMNFVGFHTYDHEPFGAYRDEAGKLVAGEPLRTSLNYNWGALGPLATEDFGFGTGRYFEREVFGSHATTDAKDREDAMLRAERDLREGLAHARSRGIHVCVGFELRGDPHDPATQRRFRARFADLLSEYPMIDHVWVWQWEGGGGGSGIPAPGTLARARMEALRPVFAYLGAEKRIAEAARMTDYVLLAHRILRQLAPEKRLIVSGWGGDRWMRLSDFYLGFDTILPTDIIFAALDNIDPAFEPNVSRVYGRLAPERERWPIPWFESDGGGQRRDQWGPQPNVKPFTLLLRDALKKGCQGVLGIHWRTRGIEEVAAYTAQFAWNPDLTYERFYDAFAAKCFGRRHAKAMSAILRELESMGSRWTGTVGQVECGRFAWTSDGKRPDPEKLARLDEIAGRLEVIASGGPRGDLEGRTGGVSLIGVYPGVHEERLHYLLTTIRWLTRYDGAMGRFLPGGPVEEALAEAARAKAEGREADARKAALRAWESVRTSGFGDAIRTYPEKLSNRGEFGVLATINVKAVIAYRQLVDRIAAFLPVGPPLEPAYRCTRDGLLLGWRPAKRAVTYRVLGERADGSAIRIENIPGTEVRLPADFRGRLQVVGRSRNGDEGPPSEEAIYVISIERHVPGSCRPTVGLCRPSSSFAAGTTIPVTAAIVGPGPIEEAKIVYRFPAAHREGEIPMTRAFRDTFETRIPIPRAAPGSAPSWVAFWIETRDAFGAVAVAPLGAPEAPFSATIEPRAFARVWRPVAVEPPVAGEDWPVVVRARVDGPGEGVSLAIEVDGGPEVRAEPLPYGSFRAVVPGEAIRDPEVRIAARVEREIDGGMEKVHSPFWTFRTDARGPAPPPNLRLASPRRYQVLLEWDPAGDDTGVVMYRIDRDGSRLGETALAAFLDGKVPSGAELVYRVIAIDGAGRRSDPAEVRWKAPAWPPPGMPRDLEARSGFGLVVLSWKPLDDTVRYRVLRSESEGGPFAAISGDAPIAAARFVDHPPEARRAYWWRVVAVDPAGLEGDPSEAVTAQARPVPREPILAADFDAPERTGALRGGARLGPGKEGKGLDLSAGGWAEFPDRVEYDDLVEFTLTLWIRPETLDPMPVVASHGHWEGPGIFLQLFGHGIRTYIGGGRVTDGGRPTVGRWQHIAVVREGDRLSTYLDGRLVARKRFPPTPVGAYRTPFRIGQYADIGPAYQVRGAIDEVRLYLRPLEEAEIREEAGR